MNASILATKDQRHLTPAPQPPPEGRRYLTPDELVMPGDLFWDATEGAWIRGFSSFEGLAARHFMTVSRVCRANVPTLRELKRRRSDGQPAGKRRMGPRFDKTGRGLMGTGHHPSPARAAR